MDNHHEATPQKNNVEWNFESESLPEKSLSMSKETPINGKNIKAMFDDLCENEEGEGDY